MGKVYLVGAGAGDVGLLTLKAYEILKLADIVVYDRLADEAILNFATNAEKIYVGKSSGQHTMKQADINNLLVDLSKRAEIIVRLKGGDPFVFGRGGEEAITLSENDVPFEIVPGVTSAIAVPAYAGIPVTHRGIAKSFAVVTGHEMTEQSNINWKQIAMGVDTLVVLMGVENLPAITQKLIESGRSSQTPAAVIQQGTKPEQRVLITTLENAASDVERKKIMPPAILIVGDVVKLREQIKWFDNKPLFGKKILVTRAREQASKLTKMLKDLGVKCIEIPAIKIVEPSDNFKSLDTAIENIESYDIIIFTSVNGVEKFFERLKLKKLDSRALYKSKIAVIGTATANELLKNGINADFMPNEFRAEAILELLKDKVKGKKILIARAEVARDILPTELTANGAAVDVVSAYKTTSDIDDKVDLHDVDLITFTSSSTVMNFINAVGIDAVKKISTAAIGPITAATLKDFGIDADIVASEYTIAGLVRAIKNFYGDD